jgi:hypothetical protein
LTPGYGNGAPAGARAPGKPATQKEAEFAHGQYARCYDSLIVEDQEDGVGHHLPRRACPKSERLVILNRSHLRIRTSADHELKLQFIAIAESFRATATIGAQTIVEIVQTIQVRRQTELHIRFEHRNKRSESIRVLLRAQHLKAT